MNSKQSDRRRFLKDGAAVAGLALGAIRSASGQTPGSETPEARPRDVQALQALGERSRFVSSVRKGTITPWSFLTPLQDSVGIITPSALHFIRAHGKPPMQIDPRQHRFMIHGMVDRPLIFTMEELQRLPSVSRVHFLECIGNTSLTIPARKDMGGDMRQRSPHDTVQLSHGLTSCSEWTGVPLSLLLKEAGVQKGATWLAAEGADPLHRTISFPLEKAMDDAIVAYGQNGEPLRPEQGFPVRLLLPGYLGNRNVKYLRRIKVGDAPSILGIEDFQDVAELRVDGTARWFAVMNGPKSVITFPSGGQRLLSPGFYEITGLAWSGYGAIRRVEISTDGGRTWKDAQLQEPVLRIAHTRFRFPWNWDGEEAVLQSRCTDEMGQVQPMLAEMANVAGISMEQLRLPTTTSPVSWRINAIQPWKVTREGSVYNAMDY